MLKRCCMAVVFAWSAMAQQNPQDLRAILERLDRLEAQNDRLEAQNRQLTQEVHSLRERLGAEDAEEAAPVTERLAVNEVRVAELAQVKIESENKFPVTLTGMLLANAYLNGRASDGAPYPVVVPPTGSNTGAGATFRQSVIGLKVDGPTVLGAKINGSVFMDFFGGGTGLDQLMRLRVATLDAAWKTRTAGIAFDKPIIAARDPDSLARVGVSPLTGSGNLWLWRPQVRVEQRHSWGDQAGMRSQFSVIQTAESGTGVDSQYEGTLAPARPGYEGRFELWTQAGQARIEIAPGFHASSSRVIGQSVPSRIFSVDWLIRPMARVELTGTFFNGQNVGVLGGLRQGITIRYMNGYLAAKPVETLGGWAQLKFRATQRASFNFFGGQQDDRNRDLLTGGIAKNQSYGANIIYRLGPNFLTSFEASQTRTTYLGSGTRINPHYDLAFAYLF